MISRRTCLLAAAAAAASLALGSAGVEAFAPQPNVRSVTKLNNEISPTGEFLLSSRVEPIYLPPEIDAMCES